MKKILILFVMLAFIVSIAASVLASPKAMLDGQHLSFDVPPIIEDGRVLVPLRAIFEALGATVEWDEATKKIIGKKDATTVTLKLGETTAQVNDREITLDVAATSIQGRTLVPIRFIAESLGAKVKWQVSTDTVIISSVIERDAVGLDKYPSRTWAWTSSGHVPKAFRGFFVNPDYDNLELFLQEDELTKRTEQVQKLADLVNNKKDMSTLKEIFNVASAASPTFQKEKIPGFFQRTASEVLSNGINFGCANMATSIATLARAKGIPAVIVDSGSMEFMLNNPGQVSSSGHHWIEVYVEGKWILLDSTRGELHLDYDVNNWNLPHKYLAYAKALSLLDFGSAPYKEPQYAALIGKGFKYADPGYEFINLADKKMQHDYMSIIKEMNLHEDNTILNSARTGYKPEIINGKTFSIKAESIVMDFQNIKNNNVTPLDIEQLKIK